MDLHDLLDAYEGLKGMNRQSLYDPYVMRMDYLLRCLTRFVLESEMGMTIEEYYEEEENDALREGHDSIQQTEQHFECCLKTLAKELNKHIKSINE